MRYSAVGTSPADEASAYRRLAGWLAPAVDVSDAIEIGRMIGRSSAGSGDSLGQFLASEGFAPIVTDEQIILNRCPFSSVAAVSGDVICAVHAGIIEGYLGADGSEVELLPFALGGACLVRTRKRAEVDGNRTRL